MDAPQVLIMDMDSSSSLTLPLIGVIHGPNLNRLGERSPHLYGTTTLREINCSLQELAHELSLRVLCYQSNVEGYLIDHIQKCDPDVRGWIINPGALMMSGYSLADALSDTRHPVIEVHLSQIFARETYRHHSVISSRCLGVITGLGAHGYLLALRALSKTLLSSSSSTHPSFHPSFI